MTPHPQRCETCQNTDCDLHEQGKHNKNPDTGYEWDHYHWYHTIINEKGCASHSSAPLPELDDDKKPGCFGAYGSYSCNIPGCVWFVRCKQSQEDY